MDFLEKEFSKCKTCYKKDCLCFECDSKRCGTRLGCQEDTPVIINTCNVFKDWISKLKKKDVDMPEISVSFSRFYIIKNKNNMG